MRWYATNEKEKGRDQSVGAALRRFYAEISRHTQAQSGYPCMPLTYEQQALLPQRRYL